ncbi:solute carrier family 22 member 3 isoform X6 [Rhinatrema bivittatum]|uniref:solute carrier family 22 member 3 isoform X6 n=1 Tax=Rhinatrema bivittatum TaxID=194408 RepID=UPI00112D8B78|nr:solute carrier family 22 member 3 isoform X6 [Rhinatrema bivittatum]
MPTFDEVLEEAGEFGSFQKRVFLLLCLTGITFAFSFAGIVFLGRTPENYWCRSPGAAELSRYCGWTPREEWNYTAPAAKSTAKSAECQRYDVEWNSTSVSCVNPLLHFSNNSLDSVPLTACQDDWVYEETHTTIISEYNLVCASAWRLDFTQAILNLGFLTGAFTLGYGADRLVPESPRWLLTRQKKEKALEIMNNIANQNGKCLTPNCSQIDVADKSVTNPAILDLFRTPQMRKCTLILMYAWFTSSVVYQGLIMRLGIVSGSLYTDFITSAIVELPAAILILLTIDRIGRCLPFALSNFVAGVACLITAFISQDILWINMVIASLGRLGITMAFEIVYFVNTELYPTTLRNFGVSLCSGMCDFGGIISPFLLFRLAAVWLELPLIIFGILAIICGGLVLLLPETMGVPLPETVEDVEKLSRRGGKQIYVQSAPEWEDSVCHQLVQGPLMGLECLTEPVCYHVVLSDQVHGMDHHSLGQGPGPDLNCLLAQEE